MGNINEGEMEEEVPKAYPGSLNLEKKGTCNANKIQRSYKFWRRNKT